MKNINFTIKKIIAIALVLLMMGGFVSEVIPMDVLADSLDYIETIKQGRSYIEGQQDAGTYVILEVVPEEGAGEMGYYIAGQEPTDAWLTKLASTASDTERKNYMNNTVKSDLTSRGILGTDSTTPLTAAGDIYTEYYPWESSIPKNAQELEFDETNTATLTGVQFSETSGGRFEPDDSQSSFVLDKNNGKYIQSVQQYIHYSDLTSASGAYYWYMPSFVEIDPASFNFDTLEEGTAIYVAVTASTPLDANPASDGESDEAEEPEEDNEELDLDAASPILLDGETAGEAAEETALDELPADMPAEELEIADEILTEEDIEEAAEEDPSEDNTDAAAEESIPQEEADTADSEDSSKEEDDSDVSLDSADSFLYWQFYDYYYKDETELSLDETYAYIDSSSNPEPYASYDAEHPYAAEALNFIEAEDGYFSISQQGFYYVGKGGTWDFTSGTETATVSYDSVSYTLNYTNNNWFMKNVLGYEDSEINDEAMDVVVWSYTPAQLNDRVGAIANADMIVLTGEAADYSSNVLSSACVNKITEVVLTRTREQVPLLVDSRLRGSTNKIAKFVKSLYTNTNLDIPATVTSGGGVFKNVFFFDGTAFSGINLASKYFDSNAIALDTDDAKARYSVVKEMLDETNADRDDDHKAADNGVTVAACIRQIIDYPGQLVGNKKDRLRVLLIQPMQEGYVIDGHDYGDVDTFIKEYIRGKILPQTDDSYTTVPVSEIDISVKCVSILEFVARTEDLIANYDMIIIGSSTAGFATDSSGKTVYNDGDINEDSPSNIKRPDGILYSNYGDVYVANIVPATEWSWSEGQKSEKNTYRASGNDLTPVRAAELEAFVDAGLPLIYSDSLNTTAIIPGDTVSASVETVGEIVNNSVITFQATPSVTSETGNSLSDYTVYYNWETSTDGNNWTDVSASSDGLATYTHTYTGTANVYVHCVVSFINANGEKCEATSNPYKIYSKSETRKVSATVKIVRTPKHETYTEWVRGHEKTKDKYCYIYTASCIQSDDNSNLSATYTWYNWYGEQKATGQTYSTDWKQNEGALNNEMKYAYLSVKIGNLSSSLYLSNSNFTGNVYSKEIGKINKSVNVTYTEKQSGGQSSQFPSEKKNKIINPDYVATTSYLYDFLTKVLQEDNVFPSTLASTVDSTYNGPKKILECLNSCSCPEMKITTVGGYTYDKETMRDKVITLSDNTLSINFNLDNPTDPTPVNSRYTFHFYIDYNGDGFFSDDEEVIDGVTINSGRVANTELKAGETYTVSMALNESSQGIIPWQLELIKNDMNGVSMKHVHATEYGYCYYEPTTPDEVSVLQICGDEEYTSDSNLKSQESPAGTYCMNTLPAEMKKAADDKNTNISWPTNSNNNSIEAIIKNSVNGTATTITKDYSGALSTYGNDFTKLIKAGEDDITLISGTSVTTTYYSYDLDSVDSYWEFFSRCVDLYYKETKTPVTVTELYPHVEGTVGLDGNGKDYKLTLDVRPTSAVTTDMLDSYDVIVLGFAEGFSELSESLATAIADCIEDGKAVVVGHDVLSPVTEKDGDETSREYYANQELISALGLKASTENYRDGGQSSYERYGLLGRIFDWFESKTYTTESSGYTRHTIVRYLAQDEVETGSDESGLTGLLRFVVSSIFGGNTSSGSAVKELTEREGAKTTELTELNKGRITTYPYNLNIDDLSKLTINTTYEPYYVLDLTLADTAVWYCLSGDYYDDAKNDAVNCHYLYSKKNVYYFGGGLSGTLNETEAKLLINTIIASFTTAEFMEHEKKGDTATATVSFMAENGRATVASQLVAYDSENSDLLTQNALSVYFRINETEEAAAGTTYSVHFYNGNATEALDTSNLKVYTGTGSERTAVTDLSKLSAGVLYELVLSTGEYSSDQERAACPLYSMLNDNSIYTLAMDATPSNGGVKTDRATLTLRKYGLLSLC